MDKKLRELLNKISNTKAAAKKAYEEGDVETGDKYLDEAKQLQAQADGLIALDGIGTNNPNPEGNPLEPDNPPKARTSIEIVRAFLKGDRTSEDVVRNISTIDEEGQQSVSLIIPQDIQNEIHEQRRSYKSARDLIGYYPTSTISGTYPVEDTSTMGDLVDFDDGEEFAESEDPKFKPVSYKIKLRGAFLPISNLLKQIAPSGFVGYLSRWWNKKTIKTENKRIFASLTAGKATKDIVGLAGIKSAINKDLDPAFVDVVIVTNQDGYDYLDNLTDKNGKPLINPDPMEKDKMLFKGKYRIEYFANRLLPSTGTKAPILIGDLTEASDFVELQGGLQIASSEHADFKKNRTLMRVVTGFDITIKDKDAYVNGLIETAAVEGAVE